VVEKLHLLCCPYAFLGVEMESVCMEEGHPVEVLNVVGHGLAGYQNVIQVDEHIRDVGKDLVYHTLKHHSGVFQAKFKKAKRSNHRSLRDICFGNRNLQVTLLWIRHVGQWAAVSGGDEI
jgi:hypothetical protein